MKTGFLFLLFILLQIGGNSLNRIARTNQLKEEAELAFKAGNFGQAAEYYNALILQWGETSDAVHLNRAHALFKAEQKEAAAEAYRQIIEGQTGNSARSIALQQLGLLAGREERLPDALQYFKDALKADPTNETARLNYELAWRKLKKQEKEKEEQKEDDQPQEQPQIEPSAWAIRQKAKADALYQQFRYNDALTLMQQSLKQDSTIAAYNDYMRRLQDVVEIDQ